MRRVTRRPILLLYGLSLDLSKLSGWLAETLRGVNLSTGDLLLSTAPSFRVRYRALLYDVESIKRLVDRNFGAWDIRQAVVTHITVNHPMPATQL